MLWQTGNIEHGHLKAFDLGKARLIQLNFIDIAIEKVLLNRLLKTKRDMCNNFNCTCSHIPPVFTLLVQE